MISKNFDLFFAAFSSAHFIETDKDMLEFFRLVFVRQTITFYRND